MANLDTFQIRKKTEDIDNGGYDYFYDELASRLYSEVSKLDVVRAALEDSGFKELAKIISGSCIEIGDVADCISDEIESE